MPCRAGRRGDGPRPHRRICRRGCGAGATHAVADTHLHALLQAADEGHRGLPLRGEGGGYLRVERRHLLMRLPKETVKRLKRVRFLPAAVRGVGGSQQEVGSLFRGRLQVAKSRAGALHGLGIEPLTGAQYLFHLVQPLGCCLEAAFTLAGRRRRQNDLRRLETPLHSVQRLTGKGGGTRGSRPARRQHQTCGPRGDRGPSLRAASGRCPAIVRRGGRRLLGQQLLAQRRSEGRIRGHGCGEQGKCQLGQLGQLR